MKVRDLIKYLQDKAVTGDEEVVLWRWDSTKGSSLVGLDRPANDQVFETTETIRYKKGHGLIALIPNFLYVYKDDEFELRLSKVASTKPSHTDEDK